MKLSVFFKVLLLSLFIYSCDKTDVNPNVKTFQIYLDYWNSTGRSPEVVFDKTNTSKEVKIDFTRTFGGEVEGGITKVIIDNFKILDNNNNDYDIQSITAYEYRPESKDYREDVEFIMDFTRTQDVGVVVLVLDRSNSLGEDFGKIKQYATSFIEDTFNSHPEVRMGIVDFSTDVKSYPITNDKEALKNYILDLEMGEFTTLYEAMDIGLDMLMREPVESRVLITFTDGMDNNSDPAFTRDNLLSRIKREDAGIRSFFIGLEGKGGVNHDDIDVFSNNGWVVSIPNSAGEVEDVFNKFAKLISNVYNLTYIRNQQVVPSNKKIKLKFDITATK